jgi:TolA-binding protein
VAAKEAAAAAAQSVLQEQMDEMGGQVAALREDAERREGLRRRLEQELKAAVEVRSGS